MSQRVVEHCKRYCPPLHACLWHYLLLQSTVQREQYVHPLCKGVVKGKLGSHRCLDAQYGPDYSDANFSWTHYCFQPSNLSTLLLQGLPQSIQLLSTKKNVLLGLLHISNLRSVKNEKRNGVLCSSFILDLIDYIET